MRGRPLSTAAARCALNDEANRMIAIVSRARLQAAARSAAATGLLAEPLCSTGHRLCDVVTFHWPVC
ncbi:Hypothetical protein MexAM1_META1p0982 [Methylorubrum extorquens AM1]|uniref:Uncharacterized protein n=1 Tax=Methylorubrum extorquens (strain ATCC 14718 / DSM 1338 / JCM 2805 / NCIMB 9133 / AM1) TaxID=272630 RepID=C5AX38_METEA|nr:Hypothetical protein MexAM1_META1p0982 [Methylorubrum extorquens AM1]